MHAIKIYTQFFDLFCVFIDDGVRVSEGLWRGLRFSVSHRIDF